MLQKVRPMRVALVSLIALAAGASAYAQTSDQTAPPASPPPAPAAAPATPASTPPAPPAATAPAPPPAATPAPAAPDTSTSAPAAGTPAAPAATETPPPAAEPVSPPPPPPAPPPPPPPPTDPTAIALLSVLQQVCIPSANGGNLPKLAKAAGYHKNGDNNWTTRTRDYTITIEDPGANPTQCHVDVTHPLDLESPGRPIIVALNDWAGIERGWSLYRNDKNVDAGMQYTTRSWTHTNTDTNKVESLVFYTQRKPDGTPLHAGVDTSQMAYAVQPAS